MHSNGLSPVVNFENYPGAPNEPPWDNPSTGTDVVQMKVGVDTCEAKLVLSRYALTSLFPQQDWISQQQRLSGHVRVGGGRFRDDDTYITPQDRTGFAALSLKVCTGFGRRYSRKRSFAKVFRPNCCDALEQAKSLMILHFAVSRTHDLGCWIFRTWRSLCIEWPIKIFPCESKTTSSLRAQNSAMQPRKTSTATSNFQAVEHCWQAIYRFDKVSTFNIRLTVFLAASNGTACSMSVLRKPLQGVL